MCEAFYQLPKRTTLAPPTHNKSISVFQISRCSLVSNLYLLALFTFAQKGPDISLRFRPSKWHDIVSSHAVKTPAIC